MELAKATLAFAISRAIESRNWTQVQAAHALNRDQPKISAILRGRLGGFSIERPMRILNALDHDIEIQVKARGVESSARTVVRLDDRPARREDSAAVTGS